VARTVLTIEPFNASAGVFLPRARERDQEPALRDQRTITGKRSPRARIFLSKIGARTFS
jgi:hypothetical protein